MDSTHLHLALNHVPVLGTPFLLGLFLWSWGRGQTATLRLCLWLFVMLFCASLVVKFTGEFSADFHEMNPEFNESQIRPHEQSADQATTGAFCLGISAALALFLSRSQRVIPSWSLWSVTFLALATFALMVRTANFGGHIRHPEIRPSVVKTP